jgi:hypothetical protein
VRVLARGFFHGERERDWDHSAQLCQNLSQASVSLRRSDTLESLDNLCVFIQFASLATPMSHQNSHLNILFARWLAKETRGLLGGLAGGVIGGVVAFTLINRFSATSLANGVDAISIANTYIVYSTLMIAAVAVFLTMAGLIFTQHFAMEKERHVADAFAALVAEMARANGCAVAVVKEVMKNAEVVQHFEDQVKEKLREVMRAQLDNADQRKARARSERDALSRIASDLESA